MALCLVRSIVHDLCPLCTYRLPEGFDKNIKDVATNAIGSCGRTINLKRRGGNNQRGKVTTIMKKNSSNLGCTIAGATNSFPAPDHAELAERYLTGTYGEHHLQQNLQHVPIVKTSDGFAIPQSLAGTPQGGPSATDNYHMYLQTAKNIWKTTREESTHCPAVDIHISEALMGMLFKRIVRTLLLLTDWQFQLPPKTLRVWGTDGCHGYQCHLVAQ